MTRDRFDVLRPVIVNSKNFWCYTALRANLLSVFFVFVTLSDHATSRIPKFIARNQLNVTLSPLLL